jgi:hypothetical protein
LLSAAALAFLLALPQRAGAAELSGTGAPAPLSVPAAARGAAPRRRTPLAMSTIDLTADDSPQKGKREAAPAPAPAEPKRFKPAPAVRDKKAASGKGKAPQGGTSGAPAVVGRWVLVEGDDCRDEFVDDAKWRDIVVARQPWEAHLSQCTHPHLQLALDYEWRAMFALLALSAADYKKLIQLEPLAGGNPCFTACLELLARAACRGTSPKCDSGCAQRPRRRCQAIRGTSTVPTTGRHLSRTPAPTQRCSARRNTDKTTRTRGRTMAGYATARATRAILDDDAAGMPWRSHSLQMSMRFPSSRNGPWHDETEGNSKAFDPSLHSRSVELC